MKFLWPVLMVISLIFSESLFSFLSQGENEDKFGVRLLLDKAIAATPETENMPQSPLESEEEKTEVKLCNKESWWERFFELEKQPTCLVANETLKAQQNNDLDDEDLLPSRGAVAVAEHIPYVISPRRTLLLNGRPIIRWNPVKDATSYTVIVKGPSGYLWQNEVTENEVFYPGEPILKPGVYYTIIVDANTGASSLDDENLVQGFEVINESDRLNLQNAAATIEATTEEESLKLAKLYRENSLRSEAIAILEKLAATGSDNQEIYQLLGKLYREIGLVNLADQYNQKAVDLAGSKNAK